MAIYTKGQSNAALLTDGYKTGHADQYPEGTEYVFSNFTPRHFGWAEKDIKYLTVFGIRYAMIRIHDAFQRDFFDRSKDEVIGEYQEYLRHYVNDPDLVASRMAELHDLGWLPIKVRALTEGTRITAGTPVLTIVNTLPEFFWITNYLETLLSCEMWLPMTSATTASLFYDIAMKWSKLTCDNNNHIDYQFHDFSMRGMSCHEAAAASGMGHLAYFAGTDTIPALQAVNQYYYMDKEDPQLNHPGATVYATEHSVMCSGGDGEDEFKTFERLITEVYPKGILSIVSDTWDLWKVLTNFLPRLKEKIEERDGKVVIRPDSGDPVTILCGYRSFDEITHKMTKEMMETIIENSGDTDYLFTDKFGFSYEYNEESGHLERTEKQPKHEGVIRLLMKTFGYEENSKGYKVLPDCIGAIYGDSINPDRASRIFQRLAEMNIAASNVVLGIGSFTYQYKTRDTHGFAMKATNVVINGESKMIYKNPVTDSGVKKSAKGLLDVVEYDILNIELVSGRESGNFDKKLLEKEFYFTKLVDQIDPDEYKELVNNEDKYGVLEPKFCKITDSRTGASVLATCQLLKKSAMRTIYHDQFDDDKDLQNDFSSIRYAVKYQIPVTIKDPTADLLEITL